MLACVREREKSRVRDNAITVHARRSSTTYDCLNYQFYEAFTYILYCVRLHNTAKILVPLTEGTGVDWSVCAVVPVSPRVTQVEEGPGILGSAAP